MGKTHVSRNNFTTPAHGSKTATNQAELRSKRNTKAINQHTSDLLCALPSRRSHQSSVFYNTTNCVPPYTRFLG